MYICVLCTRAGANTRTALDSARRASAVSAGKARCSQRRFAEQGPSLQHTPYIIATYPFHHCKILFRSLPHTPYISAVYTLNRCQEQLAQSCSTRPFEITPTHPFYHCNLLHPSLQHTAYITATYLVRAELQRKALRFAFLNTPYITATYLFPHCNTTLPPLPHNPYITATHPLHHCNTPKANTTYPLHHWNILLESISRIGKNADEICTYDYPRICKHTRTHAHT